MNAIHNTVGTLVLAAYLILMVLNLITAANGRSFSWQRPFSFGAATLLLLQYMLGFSLLGEGEDVPAVHFVLALLTIVPIGIEHGFANTRPAPRARGLFAGIANFLTLALLIIVYVIGQSNA